MIKRRGVAVVVAAGLITGSLAGLGSREAHAQDSLCKPGARLEGWYGVTWYVLTVKGPPDAQGKCPVRFDGYGPESDKALNVSDLRPLTRQVPKPAAPPPAAPPRLQGGSGGGAQAGGAAPDGNYRCHKLSPGGRLRDMGPMQVRGGRATLPGFPDGWTISQVFVRSTSSRGEIVVAVDYRTTSGVSDRLDCLPR